MNAKPGTFHGYSVENTARVKEVCLLVATRLYDVLQDDLVIVGGLVPTLLDCGDGRHVGTRDVDLAFNVGIRKAEAYTAVAERLEQAGFRPEDRTRKTLWRWELETDRARVLLEFLISSSGTTVGNGRRQRICDSLDALTVEGLDLAFLDVETVRLEGETPFREKASRNVRVCGPGAFVLLKALAFRNRGANKDAYDLHYVVRHWSRGKTDIAGRLRRLLTEPHAHKALSIIREDFATLDHLGPRRVAQFLGADEDEAQRADAWADLQDLLQLLA